MEIRIENSQEGKLFYKQTNDGNSPVLFSESDMNTDIERYWIIPELEKRFVIPFWKAERLLAKSNLKQLALKITDLEYPDIVDAEWVSFDSDLISAIEEDSVAYTVNNSIRSISVVVSNLIPTEDAAYFAFGNDIMDVFRGAYKDVGDVADDLIQDRTISARIGRNTNGITAVFFILSETIMHTAGGSAAGPSLSCGTKFPPNN